MIKLSVIVPARSEFPNCVHTIYSILHCWESDGFDSKEIECIIVDNCSDDDKFPQRGTGGTTSYLEGRSIYYNAVLRVLRDPLAGNHSARNKGAKIARGKYLFFSDAHMAYKPGFFKEILRTVDESGGLVHGCIAWMGAYPITESGTGYAYTIKLGEEWKGCVDEQTEILTREGWKKWNEVNKKTEFATLNLKYNDIEFQTPSDLTITNYKGEMVRLKGRSIDALLTPTHRTLYKGFDGKLKIKPASEIKSSNEIPIACDGYRGIYKEISSEMNNDMVELIGWIITEGSFGKKYKYNSFPSRKRKMMINSTITITQYIPEKRERIKNLLDRMNLSYCIKGKTKKDFKIHQKDTKKIMKIIPKKELTFDFILHLTKTQQKLLYDTLMSGDGYKGKTINNFYQVNTQTSNAFQLLCTCLGMATKDKIKQPWKNRFGKKPIHHISIKKNKVASDFKVNIEKYTGKIWCPTLKNGTIIIRRNGIVSITGQTWNNYKLAHDWWYIPAQGHCSVAVRKDQFLDFGGYPHVHRCYGGGEFYTDMKWWMFGSTVAINPKAIGFHLASGRGYSYNHDDYIQNVLGVTYALGCDDWRERCYLNYLRNGRKEVLDAFMTRGEKEYADDRTFVEKKRQKTFNELLVERPWDKMNMDKWGKANGAMTIFQDSWLKLKDQSEQCKLAYENSKYQKGLAEFIDNNLSQFVYKRGVK